MRVTAAVVFLLVIICVAQAHFLFTSSTGRRVKAGDGKGCAVCVIALTEVSEQIKARGGDISKLLSQVCDVFSHVAVKTVCKDIVRTFGPNLIEYLLKKEQPDWICAKVKLCKQCHLIYDPKAYYGQTRAERLASNFKEDPEVDTAQVKGRFLSGIMDGQFFEQEFEPTQRVVPELTVRDRLRSEFAAFPSFPPKLDRDDDGFAPTHLCSRGADWRGLDCNDRDNNAFPGVRGDKDARTDSNCNGIVGAEQGQTYEDKYCANYEHDRSLVFFGDSATAGFSIPVEWISLKNLTQIFGAIMDELDWPMKAWGSGWSSEVTNGESIYLKLREHNRCAHRQFQSLGKNGATMNDLVGQVNQATLKPGMKPILAFIGYIGNDVCHNTLEEMTKPEDYRKQLMAGLTLLDSKVPPNSKVMLFGLVDGRVLYNHTHDMTHPLSKHVTYPQFYEFLTCTGLNPCTTWLTSNSTMRDATTARAIELDAIAEDVAKNAKFNNIELGFIDFEMLLEEAFHELDKEGKDEYLLIDPVDGFHPSINVGHRILGRVLWNHLLDDYPHFVGSPNPNNAQIQQQFGEQGGY